MMLIKTNLHPNIHGYGQKVAKHACTFQVTFQENKNTKPATSMPILPAISQEISTKQASFELHFFLPIHLLKVLTS